MRRWAIVALGAISLVGATLAIEWIAYSSEGIPLHYWLMSDANVVGTSPLRSPGGPVYSGWMVTHRDGASTECRHSSPAWPLSILVNLGLMRRTVASVTGIKGSRTRPVDGWDEYLADSGTWPDGAGPDPLLAGTWEVEGRLFAPKFTLTLEPDGRASLTPEAGSGVAAEHGHWARSGDVLIVGRGSGAPTQFDFAYLVDLERDNIIGGPKEIGRKVR